MGGFFDLFYFAGYIWRAFLFSRYLKPYYPDLLNHPREIHFGLVKMMPMAQMNKVNG